MTDRRNTPHFKSRDIKALAKEAAVHLSDPPAFVRDAATKCRYLAPAGSGNKQITALGEAVVAALPDRERQ